MKEVIVDGLRYGKVSSIKLQGQNIIITTKLNNHEQFSKCSFVWPFLALTAFIMWDLWHDTFTWKTALASVPAFMLWYWFVVSDEPIQKRHSGAE